jgi:hypothetical protein
MVMKLFFRRGKIGGQLNGKVLPSILNVLGARTRGIGHLSLTKGDHYCAEVQDSNNVFTKHIVKVDERYCSCEKWQHMGKPCQPDLLVIIAQPFRNVGMEHFVDEYFSVEKFKKAYARKIESIGDRGFWPKVDFAAHVGVPLGKRHVGHQRKNRIKGCLEGGGSGKKSTDKESEKTRKLLRGKIKCPNRGEMGHRKNSSKCHLNGAKKRQVLPFVCFVYVISRQSYRIPLFCVQETEAKKEYN